MVVDKLSGIARITFSGRVTHNDVVAAIFQLLDHPDFRSDMPSVWDYRGCEVEGFSEEEMRQLGEVAHQTSGRHNEARLALVAGSDLQFGLSRMFIMLNEIVHLEFEVFRDINEAERWARREV